MSRRPSVFVLALTVGDYLLWNWSLNGNHDVIALIAGLTLPPLALVSLWILAFGAMRGIAGTARLMRGRGVRHAGPQLRAASAGSAARTRSADAPAATTGPERTGAARRGTRRIAA